MNNFNAYNVACGIAYSENKTECARLRTSNVGFGKLYRSQWESIQKGTLTGMAAKALEVFTNKIRTANEHFMWYLETDQSVVDVLARALTYMEFDAASKTNDDSLVLDFYVSTSADTFASTDSTAYNILFKQTMLTLQRNQDVTANRTADQQRLESARAALRAISLDPSAHSANIEQPFFKQVLQTATSLLGFINMAFEVSSPLGNIYSYFSGHKPKPSKALFVYSAYIPLCKQESVKSYNDATVFGKVAFPRVCETSLSDIRDVFKQAIQSIGVLFDFSNKADMTRLAAKIRENYVFPLQLRDSMMINSLGGDDNVKLLLVKYIDEIVITPQIGYDIRNQKWYPFWMTFSTPEAMLKCLECISSSDKSVDMLCVITALRAMTPLPFSKGHTLVRDGLLVNEYQGVHWIKPDKPDLFELVETSDKSMWQHDLESHCLIELLCALTGNVSIVADGIGQTVHTLDLLRQLSSMSVKEVLDKIDCEIVGQRYNDKVTMERQVCMCNAIKEVINNLHNESTFTVVDAINAVLRSLKSRNRVVSVDELMLGGLALALTALKQAGIPPATHLLLQNLNMTENLYKGNPNEESLDEPFYVKRKDKPYNANNVNKGALFWDSMVKADLRNVSLIGSDMKATTVTVDPTRFLFGFARCTVNGVTIVVPTTALNLEEHFQEVERKSCEYNKPSIIDVREFMDGVISEANREWCTPNLDAVFYTNTYTSLADGENFTRYMATIPLVVNTFQGSKTFARCGMVGMYMPEGGNWTDSEAKPCIIVCGIRNSLLVVMLEIVSDDFSEVETKIYVVDSNNVYI